MVKRYFLEMMYRGTDYSGFQVQDNAPNTIQGETEKAFGILMKQPITMTGSSRTDTGVHALQNFFHFDFDGPIHPQFLYKINALLPRDIVVKNIYAVSAEAHCRFDAVARSYRYYIYQHKDPFRADRACYYPYTLDIDKMQEAAALLLGYTDFTSFSKRNTQVKTFICRLTESSWERGDGELVYRVKGNRFLRGMVRGLTATMLLVGRNKLSLDRLREIVEAKDCRQADFSVPGHGLFLTAVEYASTLDLTPMDVR